MNWFHPLLDLQGVATANCSFLTSHQSLEDQKTLWRIIFLSWNSSSKVSRRRRQTVVLGNFQVSHPHLTQTNIWAGNLAEVLQKSHINNQIEIPGPVQGASWGCVLCLMQSLRCSNGSDTREETVFMSSQSFEDTQQFSSPGLSQLPGRGAHL